MNMGSGSGGILSGMFNIGTAAAQQSEARKAQRRAWKYKRLELQNRYQWTVQDMKDAGLNPILAASGGFSAGSPSSVGIPSFARAESPDPTLFSSSAKQYSEVEKNKAEVDRIRADTDKIMNEAELAGNRALESIEKAAQLRASKNLMSTQEKQVLVGIKKNYAEINEISGRIALMQTQTKELEARTDLQKDQRAQVKANIIKINKDSSLINNKIKEIRFNLKQIEKLSNVYGGPIGQLIAYTEIISKALGLKIPLGTVITRGRKK